MTRYTITKKLPSCKLDLKIARQLEKYLTHRLTKQLNVTFAKADEEKCDLTYTLSIADKYGKEDFNTVAGC